MAINYQVVSISADTALIGEDITLKFFVYNVGKTTADSFNVKTEIIYPDNSRQEVLNELVNSLQPDGKKYLVTVTGISESNVTLDANHPLAGKDLTFDIHLLEIIEK